MAQLDPAKAVVDILVAKSLGTFNSGVDSTHLCIGHLPATPDFVVLVNHTGGAAPYPHLALDEPSVQIMVRGSKNGYAAAKARMIAIKNGLLGMASILVGNTGGYNGDTYRACTMISDITYLGQDDNTRPIFSANFSFIVLPDPQGNRVAIS